MREIKINKYFKPGSKSMKEAIKITTSEIMPDEAKAAGARIKVEVRGSSTNIIYLR